jgi:hypothetical protein
MAYLPFKPESAGSKNALSYWEKALSIIITVKVDFSLTRSLVFYLLLGSRYIDFTIGFAPEAHPKAAAASSDELDPAALKRLLYCGERAFARLHGLAFDHIQGHDGEAGPGRKRSLRPFQETARSADLGGSNHTLLIAST